MVNKIYMNILMLLLCRSYSALASKNKLFEAKLLELQARMLHAPTFKGQKARFRSPLIRADDGKWIYRSRINILYVSLVCLTL